LTVTSCKKDSESSVTIIGKWKVEGFVSNSASASKTVTTDIYLTFYNNKTLNIALEVNTCSSTFSLDNSALLIESTSCTEICCDSEFSEELLELLPLVETHHFTNGKLNLKGSDNLNIRLTK
jgi:hypothetical protein